MASKLAALEQWVHDVAAMTRPATIHWCNGSDTEYQSLVQQMLQTGDLVELNQQTHPGCYLHRSNPSDVARVEHLTFVCTKDETDAGPNNHWMAPADAHAKIDALFDGCMEGRTMYVIPYCMGPIDSPLSRCGVEITDSPYVVINMRTMTRMGAAALARIEREGSFVKGLHSTGELDPDRRFIMHFPEELTIKSYGSGYGGNALLGKKCHALRIASYQARTEGWLAEHMLIVGIENPQGQTHYIAAAFPSACGKTNLAMLIPPQGYRKDGWRVWTVGDDICWMRPGADGRLYAINPASSVWRPAPATAATRMRWPQLHATPSSPMSASRPITSPGGKVCRERQSPIGKAARMTRPTVPLRIRIRASPSARNSARRGRRRPRTRKACRSAPSCLAAVVRRCCRW
jgi:phosphoenolpyruvate carboxykinase (GTP)